MSNQWKRNEDGTWEAPYYGRIEPTIERAVALAKERGEVVKFWFNEVSISVTGDSDPDLILRDFHRAIRGYIPDVSPYPAINLTVEELARDETIRIENERKDAERDAEYAREQNKRAQTINEKLENAPEFAVINPSEWDKYRSKNQDFYGGAIIAYAERWARLMQLEMAEGKRLAAIASETSHEANLEGVTGFMYGAAVQVLAAVWEHGEQLRVWRFR